MKETESEILNGWIAADSQRMEALSAACELDLPDWCLAAGFVRNLAWDKYHHYSTPTLLNDFDLIYYDPTNFPEAEAEAKAKEKEIENILRAHSALPWSVKNQARMHIKNGDKPYSSTLDSMDYWVEVETAVGVRMDKNGELWLLAPFGVMGLFAGTISLNPKRPKIEAFNRRVRDKRWLELWPKLTIVNCGGKWIV